MTDDRIRQALEQALPVRPVADPGALAGQITEVARHEFPDLFEFESNEPYEFGDGGSGTASGGGVSAGFPLFGLIGVVVGSLAGILIALSIGNPSPVSSVTLGSNGVPVFVCPGEGRAGTLHRGDRIFIIGQADGWLAVRNVRGSGETVFVEAAYVVPDHDVSDLPRRDCESEGALTIGDLDVPPDETTTTTEPGEETTTTTEADGTTTTTQPGTTTTTQPGTTTTQPGPTTTTTQAVSTTTTVPTPALGQPSASPNEIWELWDGGDLCPSRPKASVISVSAQNATSVSMAWNAGPFPRSKVMTQQGNLWSAVLGPFNEETVPSEPPDQITITVTITASGPGGSTQRTVQVILKDCVFG